jgi:hypothetical protein
VQGYFTLLWVIEKKARTRAKNNHETLVGLDPAQRKRSAQGRDDVVGFGIGIVVVVSF